VNLLRRKSIDRDEYVAGDRFARWFALAHLDPLKAADMARPFVDGGGKIPELSSRNAAARIEIARAIRYVGGLDSPGGSCLWHALGLQQSLRKWCEEQPRAARNIKGNGATSVLIMTLGLLARMPWKGPYE